MLELAVQPARSVERALQRGRNQLERKLARAAQKIRSCSPDLIGRFAALQLGAIVSLANREGWHDVKILPSQGGHDARREIGPLHVLAGLKQRLRAAKQAG